MSEDWKKRLGMVYSTNPEFDYKPDDKGLEETPDNNKQNLTVFRDRKKRKGKTVTLVSGFLGHEDDLKDLAKQLKIKCGVGGSAKNGEILIQGDFRDKIFDILKSEGFKVKKSGG